LSGDCSVHTRSIPAPVTRQVWCAGPGRRSWHVCEPARRSLSARAQFTHTCPGEPTEGALLERQARAAPMKPRCRQPHAAGTGPGPLHKRASACMSAPSALQSQAMHRSTCRHLRRTPSFAQVPVGVEGQVWQMMRRGPGSLPVAPRFPSCLCPAVAWTFGQCVHRVDHGVGTMGGAPRPTPQHPRRHLAHPFLPPHAPPPLPSPTSATHLRDRMELGSRGLGRPFATNWATAMRLRSPVPCRTEDRTRLPPDQCPLRPRTEADTCQPGGMAARHEGLAAVPPFSAAERPAASC
jgi:hypothetical protein